VDPKIGLNDLEKRKFLTLPGLELRPLGRLARSQSLYQLPNYPTPAPCTIMNLKVPKKIRDFLDEPGDCQLLNHSRVMKCGGLLCLEQ
jgi:hypothetical protein